MTSPLPRPTRAFLRDLTPDLRQLASVRRVVLDDGPERGGGAMVFSTGGGLDFWVLSGRSLDIGQLSWRGTPLAWQHPAGFVSPALHDAQADGGTGIQRSLSGFLVTCGYENARQPRNGHPLHGSLPLTPARVTHCGEDWERSRPVLFAEGEVVTAHMGGPCFRLRRRIEAPIAGNSLSIEDKVENIGPEVAEMMVLYHVNFGFPLVASDTRVDLQGRAVVPPCVAAQQPEPLMRCDGVGDAPRFHASISRAATGGWPGIAVSIEGDTGPLPYMQLWRDPRPRRNIFAIEPSNCARLDDGTSGSGTLLEPGESWRSSLRFTFSSHAEGATDGHGSAQ